MATTQTQKSIQALEKQAVILKNLTLELSKLKKGSRDYEITLDRLNKEVRKGNKLEAESLRIKQGLNRANPKHTESIRSNTSAMRAYNTERAKAVALDKKSNASGSQEGFLGGVGSRIGSYARFLAAAAGIAAVMKTLNELFIQGFKRAAEFRKAIADMAAITGLATKDLEGLSESIKGVASSTTFSVNEIAEFSKEMLKLGFSVNDVQSSMVTMAKTAQALGVGISEVGEAVGKTLNAFGLGFSESSRVTNTLVGAINSSALSFESFNTSMQYVAPVARAANVSLEETTAMMSILADSGFKASKIGTGLRTIFIELGGASSDLTRDLKELADSNLSLAEAEDLVGKRAAAQFLTLLNGIDTIDDLTESYEDLDRVNRAAAKQMDTDVERIKALGVAWDLFTQRIGGAIAGSQIMLDLLGVLDKDARNYLLAQRTLFGEKGGIGTEAFLGIIDANTDDGGAIDKQQAAVDAYLAALEKAGVSVDSAQKKLINEIAKNPEKVKPWELLGLPKDVTYDEVRDYTQGLIDAVDRSVDEATKSRVNKKGRAAAFKTIFGIDKPDDFKLSDIVTEQNFADFSNAIDDELRRARKKSKEAGAGTDAATYYESVLSQTAELRTQLTQLNAEWIKEDEVRTKAAEKRKKEEKERFAEFNANLAASRRGEDVARNAIRMKEEMEDWRAILDDYGITYDENMGYNEMKVFMKVDFPSSKQIEDEARKLQRDVANVFRSTLQDAKNGTGKFADGEGSEEGGVNALGEMLGITDKNRDDVVLIATAAVDATSDILRHAMRQRRNEAQDVAAGELAAVKNNYDLESQLLKDKLEKDLLTEQAYRAEIEKLNEERAAKENEINKRRFEAEMEYDKKLAAARFAEALGKIVINNLIAESTGVSIPAIAVGVGMATTAFATELSAINSREFVPTKFEQGGIIGGKRHSQGGTIIEAERDEYIINRGSTLNNLGLVKTINDNPNVSFEKSFADMSSTLAMIEKNTSNPKQSYLTDRDMRDSNTRQRVHRNNISI